MKKRISATVEEETDVIIDELAKKGYFRNRSHAIEVAIKMLYGSLKSGEKVKNKSQKGALESLRGVGI